MILAETGGVPGRGLSSLSHFLRTTAQLHRQGRASRKTRVFILNHLVLASNLRYVSNTFLLYQLFVERGEKIFSNCMKDIHLLHLLALNQKFYLSCSLVSQSVREYKIDIHLCKVNYMHGLKTASVQKEFQ